MQPAITSQSTPLIYSTIAAIIRDLGAVEKSRVNQQQGFKFRGIDDCYNALHSLFGKHGLFTTTQVLNSERFSLPTAKGGNLNYTILKVEFKFFALDGSSVTSVMIGEASDTGDKSTNKAMSVAQKYAFLQIFAIPTEEDKDPDYGSQEFSVDMALIQKHIEVALSSGLVVREDINKHLQQKNIDRIGKMSFNQQKEFVQWLSEKSRGPQKTGI